MWGSSRERTNGVNEAVLAELRAIRAEIHELAERVGQSATRDDLKLYVTHAEFDAYKSGQGEITAGWRFWGSYLVSGATLLLYLLQVLGVHITAGGK